MRAFLELTEMVFAKRNRPELIRAGKQLLILMTAQAAGFFTAYKVLIWVAITR